MPRSKEEETELKTRLSQEQALGDHLGKLQRHESDQRELSSAAQTRRGRMPGKYGNSARTRGTRGGEEERPLLQEEVADFIGADFRDGTGPGALPPNDVARALRIAKDKASSAMLRRGIRGCRDNDELEGKEATLDRRRQCLVHVESATTGTFFKVYEALPGAEGASGEGVSDQEFSVSNGTRRTFASKREVAGACGNAESCGAERLGVNVTEVSLMKLNQGAEVGTLLVQGVLAGLTLASLYIAWTADDLESFIASYEAQSAEYRRTMFLLCTLGLVGVQDQFFQARTKPESWERLTRQKRLALLVDPVIYVGCMVSTIICGSVDAAITNANGSSSRDWYTAELGKQSFHEKVILWQGCNVTRFLLAWVGWLLHCRRVWSVYLHFEELQLELKVQHQKLVVAGELISRLDGGRLDASESQDLRDVAKSLKSALSNVGRMTGLCQYGGKNSKM